MQATDKPRVGLPSPWGTIDGTRKCAHGIIRVCTPSHGGYWVPLALVAKIPQRWRDYAATWSHGWGHQWYEEDVAASAVLATFPSCDPQCQEDPAGCAAMIDGYLARAGA